MRQDDPFSLDKLQDLAEPDPIGWWPPAPGWWFLFALLAIWGVAWLVIATLRWRRRGYRRTGLRLLNELESQAKGDRRGAVLALSELLKRVALAAYPRERVASLTGAAWTEFLDRTSPAEFSVEPASWLASASAEPEQDQLDVAQFAAICQAARTWIQRHVEEIDAC